MAPASLSPGMAEAALGTLGRSEFGNHFKARLHNRHQHKLGNPLTGFDSEAALATVPAGHKNLALIIGVDQANQITKHDTVLVAQPLSG